MALEIEANRNQQTRKKGKTKMNLCELISIESLKERSELIKKSALDHLLKKQDQIQFINTNKDELPEMEKTIIHLHFWEGLSIYEISEVLGVSYRLVSHLKNEAIHRLRLNYLIEFSLPKEKSKGRARLELVS